MASRIACLVLIFLLVMFLLPISTRRLVASFISGELAFVLGLHFLLQSRILNIILGEIMFMLGEYFSLAVLSEFNKFEGITQAAWLLLIVGIGLCISVLAMSVIIIWQTMKD